MPNLNEIARLSARVDIDTSSVPAKLQALERQLKSLPEVKSIRIRLIAPTTALKGLADSLKRINDTTIRVGVRNSGGGSSGGGSSTNRASRTGSSPLPGVGDAGNDNAIARNTMLIAQKVAREADAATTSVTKLATQWNSTVSEVKRYEMAVAAAKKQEAEAAAAKARAAKAIQDDLKRIDTLIKDNAKQTAVFSKELKQGEVHAKNLMAQFRYGVGKWGNDVSARMSAISTESKKVARNVADSRSWLLKMRETIMAFGTGYLIIQGIGAAFGALKRATIDYNQTIDQATISFTTKFRGNVVMAKELLGTIEKFNVTSPFELTELLPATNRLMAMGIGLKDGKLQAEEFSQALRGIGEQTAAIDGSIDTFNGISRALGQISLKGKVYAEELVQLQERGVPALQILADSWGTNTAQMQEWITKGMVPGKKAVEALTKGMEANNLGQMAEQSKTLKGAMSNLVDGFNKAIGTGFRPMFDSLSALGNKMADMSLDEGFANWAKGVGDSINTNLTGTLVVATNAWNDMGKAGQRSVEVIGALVLFRGPLTAMAVAFANFSGISALIAAGGLKTLADVGAALALAGPALGVLAIAIAAAGVAWFAYTAKIREVGKAHTALAANGKEIKEMLSEMKRFSTDSALTNRFSSLQERVNKAGTDATKLREVLKDLQSMRRDIIVNPKLGTDLKQLMLIVLERTQSLIDDRVLKVKVAIDRESMSGLEYAAENLGKLFSGAYEYDPNLSQGRRESLFGLNRQDAMYERLQRRQAIAGAAADRVGVQESSIANTRARMLGGYAPNLNIGGRSGAGSGLDIGYTSRPGTLSAAGTLQSLGNASWEAQHKNALAKVSGGNGGGKGTLDESDLLAGKNNAVKKAADKLQKDRLEDLVATYGKLAKAAEDSAKRQIDALKSLGEKMTEMFAGPQEELLRLGIGNDPLSGIIGSMERMLDIGPRARKIIEDTDAAIAKLNKGKAGAQSALDVLTGGDGSGPGYGRNYGGMAKMGSVFREMNLKSVVDQTCADVATATLNGLGIQFKRTASSSAARKWAQENWQKVDPKTAPAGSIMFERSDKARSGWHTVMGAGNGRVLSSSRHRVSEYGARDSMEAYAPGAAGGKVPKYYIQSEAATLAARDGAEELKKMLDNISTGSSKYMALPKEWKGAVKDAAGNATVFQMQMFLANKQMQTMMRAYLGPKFGAWVKSLREAGYVSDKTVNAAKSGATITGNVQQLYKKGRMRDKSDGPMAAYYALLDERKNGGPDSARTVSASAFNHNKYKLLEDIRADASYASTKATKASVQAEMDKITVLRAGAPILREAGASMRDYERAIAIATNSMEVEHNAIIQTLRLTGQQAQADKDAAAAKKAFIESYDFAQSQADDKAYSAALTTLSKEFKGIGVETVQAAAKLKIYNDEQFKGISVAKKDVLVRKEIRNELAKLADARRRELEDMREKRALLEGERKVLNGGLGAREQEEAIALNNGLLERFNELARTGALSMEAIGDAGKAAFGAIINQRIKTANDTLREHNKLVQQTKDNSGLQLGLQNVIGKNALDPRASEEAQASVNAWQQALSANEGSATQGVDALLDWAQAMKQYRDNVPTKDTTAWAAAMLDAKIAAVELTHSIAEQTAAVGGMTGLEAQNARWKAADAIASANGTIRTKEQTKALEEQRDVIRGLLPELDALASKRRMQALQDEADLYKFKPGDDRERERRRLQVMRDDTIPAGEKDGVIKAGEKIEVLRDYEQRMLDIAASTRTIIGNSLSDGFRDGVGSGVQTFIKGLSDMVQSTIMNDITKRITNKIFGIDEKTTGLGDVLDAWRGKGPGGTPPIASMVNSAPQQAGSPAYIAAQMAGSIATGGPESVGAMTVTAGTVNVNGGMKGGGAVGAIAGAIGLGLTNRQGSKRVLQGVMAGAKA